MKKIAIFVEGYSEALFLKSFLLALFIPEKLNVIILNFLTSLGNYSIPDYIVDSPEIEFYIYLVGNDEKVVSSILEQSSGIVNKGTYMIYGLRDMNCDTYHKLIGPKTKKVYQNINQKIIDENNLILNCSPNISKIKLFFSVMEIESWFISFNLLFERINPILKISYMNSKLKLNLDNDDIEKYFKPKEILDKIFRMIGRRYKKHKGDVMLITNKLTKNDIKKSILRMNNFKLFYDEITNQAPPLLNG